MRKIFPRKLFWLLCCLPCWGQTHHLEVRFEKGMRWSFVDSLVMEISSTALAGGVQKISFRHEITEEVTEARPDGSLDLTIRLNNTGKMGKGLFGTVYDFKLLEKLPIVVKMVKDGSVSEVVKPPGLPREAELAYNMIKQFYLYYNCKTFFPLKPVAIGETWQRQQVTSFDTNNAVIDNVLDYRVKLLGLEDVENRRCFKLEIEGDFDGSLSQGTLGTLKGKMTGKSYFDVETGQSLKFDIVVDQTVREITDAGEMDIKMHIASTRQFSAEADVR